MKVAIGLGVLAWLALSGLTLAICTAASRADKEMERLAEASRLVH